jgi:hypothetical protein
MKSLDLLSQKDDVEFLARSSDQHFQQTDE